MSISEGFLLDRRWHWLRGQMERTKEPDLALLARILGKETEYAVIGGVALQAHEREPRTTLDIDVAVIDLERLPREDMKAAGFAETGRYAHSDNWVGPEGTPVQFTDDPAIADAVSRAEWLHVGALELRVLGVADLLHEKIRAGSDPARRRSKRLQDLADAQSLIEQRPELEDVLTPSEKAVLDSLPR